MQEIRALRKTVQVRVATTSTIQPTTTQTTKLSRTTNIFRLPTRNIIEEEQEDIHNSTEETIDPESTCYIREMMEDWQNTTNFNHSVKFTNEKVSDINKTRRREFWLKTYTNKKQTYWLADTGSLRSFMNIQTAKKPTSR